MAQHLKEPDRPLGMRLREHTHHQSDQDDESED
jgi:hypothetical protein